MEPKKVSKKKKISQNGSSAFSSNLDSSSESEQASSSSSDDSDSEESDSSSEQTLKNKSRLKNESCVKDESESFALTCLHSWDESKLSSCFTKYHNEITKRPTTGKLALQDSTSLKAWWDDFATTKPSKNQFPRKPDSKEADSFVDWFNKSSKEPNNSTWLAGSGPSTESTKPSTSQVEDIEVPSIYNMKPNTKGRRALKKERKAEKEKTLGKKWFEMKAPDVDDKLKNDMELIRMRGVLDPKRFYKHNDRKALPKYFQMGTVVDEGSDFYSNRLPKKQRKQTLVEQLMADANVRQYNKRKYAELQQKMRSKKKLKGKKSSTK